MSDNFSTVEPYLSTCRMPTAWLNVNNPTSSSSNAALDSVIYDPYAWRTDYQRLINFNITSTFLWDWKRNLMLNSLGKLVIPVDIDLDHVLGSIYDEL